MHGERALGDLAHELARIVIQIDVAPVVTFGHPQEVLVVFQRCDLQRPAGFREIEGADKTFRSLFAQDEPGLGSERIYGHKV
jgi:hypothetical protein